jgi:hypothetical protein
MSSENGSGRYLLDGCNATRNRRSGRRVPLRDVIVSRDRAAVGRFDRGCCPFAAQQGDLERRRPGGSDPPGRLPGLCGGGGEGI